MVIVQIEEWIWKKRMEPRILDFPQFFFFLIHQRDISVIYGSKGIQNMNVLIQAWRGLRLNLVRSLIQVPYPMKAHQRLSLLATLASKQIR